MRIKRHKRDRGTSRNLKVMVESHMMLLDMVKIVKGNFMSLGFVYIDIHSFLLIQGQNDNTEHSS